MEKRIEKIKKFRHFLLNQVDGLTTEQLNTIPQKCNNNIIWNLGHLICAEETMCYARAGLPMIVDDKYISLYKSGTKPGALVEEKEIESIKQLFIGSIDRLQADFDQKKFANYSASVMIPKVYGFEVQNIDDALDYLLYHEGYHAGYITSLIHLV